MPGNIQCESNPLIPKHQEQKDYGLLDSPPTKIRIEESFSPSSSATFDSFTADATTDTTEYESQKYIYDVYTVDKSPYDSDLERFELYIEDGIIFLKLYHRYDEETLHSSELHDRLSKPFSSFKDPICENWYYNVSYFWSFSSTSSDNRAGKFWSKKPEPDTPEPYGGYIEIALRYELFIKFVFERLVEFSSEFKVTYDKFKQENLNRINFKKLDEVKVRIAVAGEMEKIRKEWEEKRSVQL